jgi:Ca2+:H+ antiporter
VIPALSAISVHSQVGPADLILELSHDIAIIMLILYMLSLLCQFKLHYWLFIPQVGKESEATGSSSVGLTTLSPISASITMIIATILMSICSYYLVGSIDSVVKGAYMSRTFIDLILLPIILNGAPSLELVRPTRSGYSGGSAFTVDVVLGHNLNITLFSTPFLVILGLLINKDMTLDFGLFQTVVFFVSVVIVNCRIRDGRSNFLEGALCIGM